MNKKLTLLAGLVAVYGGTAQAATLCAHPEGKGSCFGTIQAAVDAAAAGDTIKIKSGTYYEAVTVDSTKTGLTIQGSKSAIIDSDDTEESALTIEADDVTVMKLSIHNADNDGIYVDGGANVLIRGVNIRNTSSDCIEVEASGAVIEKNRLQACGSDGIDVDGDDAIVRKNRISQISSDGIRLLSDNAIIEKNRITGIEGDGIDTEERSDNLVISKNKITDVDGDGIQVDGHNLQVTRNKVAYTGDDGIVINDDDPWDNPDVSRNRVAHTGSEGIEFECDTCDTALLEANMVKFAFNDANECFDISAASDGLLVNKNAAQNCGGDGFDVTGEGEVLITSNRSLNAGFNGSDDGFDINGLGKKTLVKNQARGSSDDGFDISDGDEAVDPGDPEGEHVLEKNKAIDNSDDGFDVDFNAVGTTLLNNKSTRNIANGISLYSDDNTVTGNKAKGNREGFDFCNEGSDSTLTGNKFGSESTECSPNP